jgi:MFS transporter, ACS family, hexuronate transporter
MSGGRSRWILVVLLFAATTINYIDRQTLSILAPTLRRELHLTEHDYANIVTAFLIPYTVMYSLGGRLIDRIGPRVGLALSLTWWSLSTVLTGFARSAFGLGAARFALGIGEPCVYPAGVKVCSEHFRDSQRALAVGIFSAGSSVGAIIAPPLIALTTVWFGWRAAFAISGLLGLILVPLWLIAYPGKEIAATSTPLKPGHTWLSLLRVRRVWALILPRFLSDPVWYFYLFWLPDYLQRERHLSLTQLALFGWLPFFFADLGAILGGALSDSLVRLNMTPARARIAVLVGVGCLSPLGAFAGIASTLTTALAIICLVAFLTQCWSTNTATLISDLVPEESTSTTMGMMGTAGGIGGILFAQLLAVVIREFGYPYAFALAAVLHPVAALVLVAVLRSDREGSHCPPG